MISVTDGKTIPRYQTRQTLFNIQPLKDVTMFDLEEIDLSAAPGTTNARKIRAGKKNVAKILARARSMPSWKRSLQQAWKQMARQTHHAA